MSSITYQVVPRTKRMVELALGSIPSTTLSLIGNFTSDGLAMPEEVPKNARKLSRNSSMLEKTDSEFAWLLPSSRFKVSISPTSRRQISLVPRPLSSGGGLETRLPPDLLPNVTATNYALQGTCFTLCQVEQAILWKQRKHRPLFSHPIFC